ncbi:MAG: pentapeptide repeat-containing protein [Bradyrhizobium sp.]|uniref:pentapeptide repeat-containing protein n=1 Tax=Bradyrhizobium sp. TaxID=376 RepID=UPI0027320207|nr:pentapeptide repeat-containing protein [Bradyrhizobium sp.]MDP1865962.1 pentapeptide repeat-containing protein [Bradyrhizobium sp.]
MIEVRTLEQLTKAIRTLRLNHERGMGTIELIRSLGIDPLTQLRGSDWRATNFGGCDLKGADLSDCRLAFCDFTDADVAGAMFFGSDLHMSTLHRAKNLALAYMSSQQRTELEKLRERDARGHSSGAHVFLINGRIRIAESFQEAKKLFGAISSEGLEPDMYSAALLIGKAQNSVEAWDAYHMIQSAKCQVNNVAFVVLASKMDNIADIRDVMGKMRGKGYAPNVQIFTTLLARTRGLAAAEEVLEEMKSQQVHPSNVTYQILMRRTDFAGRKTYLSKLVSERLHPGTAELNLLLRGATREDEADDAIEMAHEYEISRDALTYALLAPYKARPDAFEALTNDMAEDDINRNSEFYKLAVNRSRMFRDACFLYGCMKLDRIEPHHRMYERFCELAEVLPTAIDPDNTDVLKQEIASLIRRKGTFADVLAAGLT